MKYAIVAVSGADSFDFLQAQLTADLTPLAGVGDTLRAGWCNPKGRVICLPRVSRTAAGFDLELPAEMAESVVNRLTLFRFRAQVEFELQTTVEMDTDARLQQLQAGIAEIALAQTEKFTPHMLNLDLLQMVSLDKGCYPGQEIVARTHYRGASKRRCLRFTSSAPLRAGDKLTDGSKDVGEVVNAIGQELLAVLPVSIAAAPLQVGDVPLQARPLPYEI